MLENVDLKLRISREEYKRVLPRLQNRLYDLEKACWDNSVSSIVLFEGWDAAGRGSAISTLTQRLDPRGFKLYPISKPRTLEQQHPWLWRFWLKIPNRGEMVIFHGSWYYRVIEERIKGSVSGKLCRQAYSDILEFERMLADGGTAILKFFLHISKKEQKKRFEELEADPLKSWRITKADWARHEKYNDYLVATEQMLELTDSEFGPWTIVEATSKWWTRKRIFEGLIAALETRLGSLAPPPRPDTTALEDEDLRAAMEMMSGEGRER